MLAEVQSFYIYSTTFEAYLADFSMSLVYIGLVMCGRNKIQSLFLNLMKKLKS